MSTRIITLHRAAPRRARAASLQLRDRSTSPRPTAWFPRPAPTSPTAAIAAIAAALAVVFAAAPARAQVNALVPMFRSLNGAAVWASAGFATSNGGGSSKDQRPMWRGGFAVFYGPFGGRGDTLVTFTQTVSDSSDTTLCDCPQGSSNRLHRRTRSTRELRVDGKRLGGNGRVTLLIGYQQSSFYRFGPPLFEEAVPVGGAFLAAVLGPYRLPIGRSRFEWYAGGGGTVVKLHEIAVRASGLEIQLSTERTLAPEALFMLMYRVSPGYRLYLGTSYQYLRFASVTYRAIQAGDYISPAVLATLPGSLSLQSVHLSLGLTFTAPGLLSGR